MPPTEETVLVYVQSSLEGVTSDSRKFIYEIRLVSKLVEMSKKLLSATYFEPGF